jgi:hypothetical protein
MRRRLADPEPPSRSPYQGRIADRIGRRDESQASRIVEGSPGAA